MLSSSMKFHLAVLSSSRTPMLDAEGGATALHFEGTSNVSWNLIVFRGILKSFWPLVGINVIVIILIVEYWKSMCFARSQGSKLEEVEVGNAKFEQVAVESGKFTHRLPSCEGHSKWTRLDPSLENRRTARFWTRRIPSLEGPLEGGHQRRTVR